MRGAGVQKSLRGGSVAGRRGQAVVEFALILPVFCLLVFGAVEFGRAYYNLHILANAAREGARKASLPDKTTADVEDTVAVFLDGAGLAGGTATIVVKDQDGVTRAGGLADALEGDRVYVTVTYDFNVLVGSLIPGFSGTIQLQETCAFRHE